MVSGPPGSCRPWRHLRIGEDGQREIYKPGCCESVSVTLKCAQIPAGTVLSAQALLLGAALAFLWSESPRVPRSTWTASTCLRATDANPPQRTTGNTRMKERNPCPILRTPSTS